MTWKPGELLTRAVALEKITGGGHMKQEKENREFISRRNMLKNSAFFLAGGIVGGIGSACSTMKPDAQAATAPNAPPLPWKWVELDPMEAGRRAYHYYHSDKG